MHRSISKRFGQTAAIMTVILGSTALLGWGFGIQAFKCILPGLAAMKATTALGFVLAGFSLYSLCGIQEDVGIARRKHPILLFVGPLPALIILLFGLAALSQFVLFPEMAIGQLLFSETEGSLLTTHSGRMPPLASAGFIGSGGSLLWLHCFGRGHTFAQLLALLVMATAIFTVGCYLFGVSLFEGKLFPAFLQKYPPMAIHAALGFLLLSGGILAADSGRGFLSRWRTLLPDFGIGLAIALLIFSGAATIFNWERMLHSNSVAVLSSPVQGEVRSGSGPVASGGPENENAHIAAMAALGITLIFSAALVIIAFEVLRFQLGERRSIEQKLHESNSQLRRFKSVIDSMPAYIFIKDRNRRYRYANQRTLAFFKCSEKEMLGCEDTRFFPAETAKHLAAIDSRVLRHGETTEEEIESTIDGDRRFYWEIKRPIYNEQGKIDGLIGLSMDISERKKADEAMRLAELVYQNSSEGMAVTDANGVILSVNPAFSRITGYAAEEAIGKTPRILKSGRHDLNFYKELWQALNTDGFWQGEICNRRKNGELYTEWITINSIFNPDGSVFRHVSLFTDITQRKELERKIWKQAYFDALTGLPNRPMFYDRLGQDMLKAQRHDMSIALLLLDLDRFKEINDTLGHHYGDKLLKETAQRLVRCARKSDTVARLGGDEFAIILCDLRNNQHAERVALEVLRQLAVSFKLNEYSIFISVSIGISVFPADATEIDQLLANADQAMYAAKEQGRSRYCYFEPAMQETMLRRVRLIEDLRKAMASRQFTLHYQPVVSLQTGALVKAEALIRWLHPERGMISPTEFIPLAEETGLIIEIGDWVFHEAVSQLVRWQSLYGPDFQISVNKSPVQFCRGSHNLNQWINYLRRRGLPGNGIVIEITEGLLMDERNGPFDILLEFQRFGIQVAIDDFGTGYSSMAYLKKFHIDYLKIDQSFTRHMATDSDSLVLCEAIVVMAHKLGLQVIAEGVNSVDQRDLLTRIGCDYAQGYLFSEPLSPEKFEESWRPV